MEKSNFNKLLQKQLSKHYTQHTPENLEQLLRVVSQTYDFYERDRQLIERSMEISSQEMVEVNQKLAEQTQKLKRSNEELREFAFAVSHDLKEPLRTIASYIQLIELRLKDNLDYETKEFMQFSVQGVKRMQQMLEAMLRYAQVEGSNRDFTEVLLADVVSEAGSNLSEIIRQTNTHLTTDHILVKVKGNRFLLVQLFQNLFANSIKFRSAEVPHIQVFTQSEGNMLRITVQDNGIGIKDDSKEKYFVMFKKEHAHNYEGIGMGLSICKKIVEHHEGAIRFEETSAPGVCISFTLPLAYV